MKILVNYLTSGFLSQCSTELHFWGKPALMPLYEFLNFGSMDFSSYKKENIPTTSKNQKAFLIVAPSHF